MNLQKKKYLLIMLKFGEIQDEIDILNKEIDEKMILWTDIQEEMEKIK